MTPRDFAYWLQGYFEILDPKHLAHETLPLTARQAQCIREHLALVFQHIEPTAPAPKPSQPAVSWPPYQYPFTPDTVATVC